MTNSSSCRTTSIIIKQIPFQFQFFLLSYNLFQSSRFTTEHDMSFKLQYIRVKIEKIFFLDVRSKNDHNYKKAYEAFTDEKHFKIIKVAVEEEES